MITSERVKELVEQKLEGSEYFLVDVQVKPGNRIAVFIDRDKGGISINDCVELSKFVENALNRDVEDFELEVSSPGMGQPLKLLRQYIKYRGRQVSVLLADGRRIEGRLAEANEDGILVEETTRPKSGGQGKSKQAVVNSTSIPFDQVKETKIVISFN